MNITSPEEVNRAGMILPPPHGDKATSSWCKVSKFTRKKQHPSSKQGSESCVVNKQKYSIFCIVNASQFLWQLNTGAKLKNIIG